MRVILTVDDREKTDCTPRVTELIEGLVKKELQGEYVIVRKRLELGDFAIDLEGDEETSPMVRIEKKTYDDFRASFVNQRLQLQVDNLSKAKQDKVIPHIAFLLEGERPSTVGGMKRGKPSYMAIEKILTGWYHKLKMEILRAKDLDETAFVLYTKMIYVHDIGKLMEEKKHKDLILTARKEKAGNPFESAVWRGETAEMKRIVHKVKQSHKVIEPWIYLPMFLHMFTGITMERAIDISAKFGNSMANAVALAKQDPETFKTILLNKDNIKYSKSVSKVAVELVYTVLTSQKF